MMVGKAHLQSGWVNPDGSEGYEMHEVNTDDLGAGEEAGFQGMEARDPGVGSANRGFTYSKTGGPYLTGGKSQSLGHEAQGICEGTENVPLMRKIPESWRGVEVDRWGPLPDFQFTPYRPRGENLGPFTHHIGPPPVQSRNVVIGVGVPIPEGSNTIRIGAGEKFIEIDEDGKVSFVGCDAAGAAEALTEALSTLADYTQALGRLRGKE